MKNARTIEVKPRGWHEQQKRRELFARMRVFEQAFEKCDKLYSTQEWLRLQDELGKIYKEIMEIYGKG